MGTGTATVARHRHLARAVPRPQPSGRVPDGPPALRKLVVLVGFMLVAVPATAHYHVGLRGGVGFATVSIEEAGVEEESVSRIVPGSSLALQPLAQAHLSVGND